MEHSVAGTTTRKRFLASTAAAVGGVFAYAAGLPIRDAAAGILPNCLVQINPICLRGTTKTCRVRFGPPSCSRSRILVYSPNERHDIDCIVTCPGGCGCEPYVFQARAAVTNGGKCSCHLWV